MLQWTPIHQGARAGSLFLEVTQDMSEVGFFILLFRTFPDPSQLHPSYPVASCPVGLEAINFSDAQMPSPTLDTCLTFFTAVVLFINGMYASPA